LFPFDVVATTHNSYDDFECLFTAYCIDDLIDLHMTPLQAS